MENKGINLALNGVKIGIVALGVLLFLLISGTETNEVDGLVSTALGLTYVAFILCTVAAVGFGLYLFITNLKNNKAGLYGIIGFVVVILLAYLLASSDSPSAKLVVEESTSKWVGTGLIAFYLLIAATVGTIIYTEVRKITK